MDYDKVFAELVLPLQRERDERVRRAVDRARRLQPRWEAFARHVQKRRGR